MLTRNLHTLQRLQTLTNRILPFISRFNATINARQADIGIINGTIVNGDRKYDGDVYIKDSKIISITDRSDTASMSENTPSMTAKRIIDAKSKYIIPGGIDPHTHMQLPFMGEVAIDDFNYGTRAALAGGTTMLIDFIVPSNSENESLVDAYKKWRGWADDNVNMDYGLHVAITRWDDAVYRDMETLVNTYGVTSFKIFLAYDGLFQLNDKEIIAVMKRAKELGALVMCHAENGHLISYAQQYIFEELGISGPEGHQMSRPAEFEGEATHRAITIANFINTPLYVVHVQSDDAWQMVRRAKNQGYIVYGECLAAGLGADGNKLWDKDFEIAAGHVMSPPISIEMDKSNKIINYIQSGDCSTVGTDNCTFTRKQKKDMGFDDFRKIPNGVNGIEDRLSIVWNQCVKNGKISPQQFVDITSANAARIFNLYPKKGRIDVGSDADVVIWNPYQKRVISEKTHHHRVDFNIFEGLEVEGTADVTISNGNIVWENNKLKEGIKGTGNFIARKPFGAPFEMVKIRDIERMPKPVDRSTDIKESSNIENDDIDLFDEESDELISFENIMEKYIKPQNKRCYDEINRIVYGIHSKNPIICKNDKIITEKAFDLCTKRNFEISAYKICGNYKEETREERNVTIGAIQNKYHPVNFQEKSIFDQKQLQHSYVGDMIYSAAECGVNILCLQEAWNMPFAFCTREKHWTLEFAEYIDLDNKQNISLQFISSIAKECNICIISSMLERDIIRDTIHNTVVIIGNDGNIIGKHRKNHIPRIGDFNESTYYMEGDTGHPVFNLSQYNDCKIGINICYGRHHPLNWLLFGLNGAEIVFNPSATTSSLSEHLWNIEARNASIANNYYTVSINRIGTEYFTKTPFTSGDGKSSHNDFGHFYGSTFITAPNGSRTYGLNRINDGLLIANIDLNLCRQIKDEWGFQMTARYDLYAQKLNEYVDQNQNYKQQIIYDDKDDDKKY